MDGIGKILEAGRYIRSLLQKSRKELMTALTKRVMETGGLERLKKKIKLL